MMRIFQWEISLSPQGSSRLSLYFEMGGPVASAFGSSSWKERFFGREMGSCFPCVSRSSSLVSFLLATCFSGKG